MTGPADVAAPAPSRVDKFLAIGVSALFLAAFAPTLVELATYWWNKPEYSHGFLMPVVAAWMLRERRSQLEAATVKPSVFGLLLLLACLFFLTLGEMKLSWFFKPYAFVGGLVGLVWAFRGWETVRIALPAITALFLMCPLPGRIQYAITLPLKHSAAVLATGLLDLSGVPVTLEGNLIRLPGLAGLWVADACSGISSLISLVTIAILACFFWKVPIWLRAVVVVSAVPIAIVVNGVRIWLTGLLSLNVGPEAAEGFFHFFEGLTLFIVGGVLLFAWAMLLNQVRKVLAS